MLLKDKNRESTNKASLLSKITHELKSPIHGIMSLADYLECNWDIIDTKTLKRCISEINKSSHSLNFLIDSLFDLSRIKDNEIQFNITEIEFDPIIKEALQMLGLFTISNEKISINYVNEAKKEIVLADRIWLKQLVTNVLINSVKFTKEGNITIRVSNTKNENIDYTKFSIRDEGIGISEDEIDRIFQEFYKGQVESEIIQNHGLGLAICEEIVRAHNGDIWVYNNLDKGITVEFIIPEA